MNSAEERRCEQGSAPLRSDGPSSEKHIKVEHEAPGVIPEERAILRISDVGVHFKRIKVIGQITQRTREPHSVFRADLDIF